MDLPNWLNWLPQPGYIFLSHSAQVWKGWEVLIDNESLAVRGYVEDGLLAQGGFFWQVIIILVCLLLIASDEFRRQTHPKNELIDRKRDVKIFF